jgi:hypothetical protein
VEFYTHRHSGVVTSLEVLSVRGNVPASVSTTEATVSEEAPQDTESTTEAIVDDPETL